MAEAEILRRVAGLAVALALLAGCGDPAPSDAADPSQDGSQNGQFQCLGVVSSRCNQMLRDAQQQGVVTAIRIVCTKPPCTELQGEVTIDVVYANGQRSSMGQGWGSVGGGPVPPPVGADPSG